MAKDFDGTKVGRKGGMGYVNNAPCPWVGEPLERGRNRINDHCMHALFLFFLALCLLFCLDIFFLTNRQMRCRWNNDRGGDEAQ